MVPKRGLEPRHPKALPPQSAQCPFCNIKHINHLRHKLKIINHLAFNKVKLYLVPVNSEINGVVRFDGDFMETRGLGGINKGPTFIP